ncbi:MAG: amino acid-binding protein [Pseudomonadota bacterium]
MTHSLLISIFCPDRTRLVSSITGSLFNLGVNLSDTSFVVLGAGAEFTTVCDSPVNQEELESHLRALPELEGADIKVSQFSLSKIHGPNAKISHIITLRGANHPGLIAQLSEVIMAFDANIVRLDAETIPGNEGEQYLINLSVCIPESRVDACLASVTNTASSLQMHCHWVSPSPR